MDNLQVSAIVSNAITCTQPTAQLFASAPASGVAFNWTGPGGFSSTLQSLVVDQPGTYIVTATLGTETASATVNVFQNILPPSGVSISKSGDLGCTSTSVTLTGSSTTPGAIYAWAGPANFTSSSAVVSVSVAGVYTLTVTNPANGCNRVAFTTVVANASAPLAIAGVSGLITCNSPNVTLFGSSSTSSVTYQWAGPNGFASTSNSPVVSTPGVYTLTVTNPTNGCSTNAMVVVLQNGVVPIAVANVSGIITCDNPTVTLNGSSSSPNVTFNWTGPGGFSSEVKNPLVSIPGTYVLAVTNPVNGCKSSTSVRVIQDTQPCSSAESSALRIGSEEVKNGITAYPNPAKGKMTLSFTATESGHYKLNVYSLDGGRAYKLFDGKVAAGHSYKAVFEGDGSVQGIYVYKLFTQKAIKQGKFILTK